MIIYNSTWSFSILLFMVMVVRLQSDLVNTKIELPVYLKPYHTIKRGAQKGKGIEDVETIHFMYHVSDISPVMFYH